MKWKVAVPGSYVKPTGLVGSRIWLNLTWSSLWWSWMSHWITGNSFIFPNCENEPANNQAKKIMNTCKVLNYIDDLDAGSKPEYSALPKLEARRSHLGDGLHSPWFFGCRWAGWRSWKETWLKWRLPSTEFCRIMEVSNLSSCSQVGLEVKKTKPLMNKSRLHPNHTRRYIIRLPMHSRASHVREKQY